MKYTLKDVTIKSMVAYIKAGQELGMKVDIIDPKRYIKFTKNKTQFYIYISAVPTNSHVASRISINKFAARQILKNGGIPVPESEKFLKVNEAYEYAKKIGDCVVKPQDSYGGTGITIKPKGKEQFIKAFKYAKKNTGSINTIIVEKFIKGNDYRALVAGNKVVGVTKKHIPFVIGDGKSTLKKLINKENKKRSELDLMVQYAAPILVDNELKKTIHDQGYTFKSIIPKRKKVKLRLNGNISSGGLSENCTDKIHPSVAKICIKATKLLGLDVGGVDILIQDISKPLKNAAIIESQCSDPDSYMVSTSLSHEVQSRIFSVLMTAKVANQPVKINVKGCEDNRPAITSAILL